MFRSIHGKWIITGCATALAVSIASSAHADPTPPCPSGPLQIPDNGGPTVQNIGGGEAALVCQLQDITNYVDVISKAASGFGAIEAGIGLILQTPSPETLILNELNKIQTEIGQLTSSVGKDVAGTDFQILESQQQTWLTQTIALLSNQLHSLPVDKPTADYALRQFIGFFSQSTSFTHGTADAATDGVVTGAVSNIGGSTYNSAGGTPWKNVMPDREAVRSGDFQVFDWRVGVPTLLAGAGTAFLIAEKLDPDFRWDGMYQSEFTAALNALEGNLATMTDGVRCGVNTNVPTYTEGLQPGNVGAGYIDTPNWQYGCADIYTGINQTYTLPNLPRDFYLMLGYHNPGNAYHATNCNEQNWWVVPNAIYFSGTNPSYCDPLADAFTQPITTAARDAVFAQMPRHAMRKLIGVLTQITNPKGTSSPSGAGEWTACPNGSPLVPGDTGCKGAADITMVPTNMPVNIEVAANNINNFTTLSQPTQAWPDQYGNAYWFVNSWVNQAAFAVPGEFTGDGRWDIALLGGPGWWSIPVAHALGDGTYFVTNLPTGIHATNCGGGVSPNWQCSRQNFSTDTPTPYVYGHGQPYNLDFTWAASQPGVRSIAGDFDGDGFSDIALVGGTGWTTIPVAFGDGAGGFANVTNYASINMNGLQPNPSDGWHEVWDGKQTDPTTLTLWSFPQWAALGIRAVGGDFDGDHLYDIALVLNDGSIAVAFSKGDGTFRVTRSLVFPTGWVQTPGAQVKTGDFDGDGRFDVALAGGSSWTSVPVAFSNGDGTFAITNNQVDPQFTALATGAQLVTGDLDGDSLYDIGSVTEVKVHYTAYIPEFLSAGRSGFATVMRARYYVNNDSTQDFWDNSSASGPPAFTPLSAF